MQHLLLNIQDKEENFTLNYEDFTQIQTEINQVQAIQQDLDIYMINFQFLLQQCQQIVNNNNINFDSLEAKFERWSVLSEKEKQLFYFFKQVLVQIQTTNLKLEELNLNNKHFNNIQSRLEQFNQNVFQLFDQAKDLCSKFKTKEALEKFSQVLSINPSFIDARLSRGKLYLDLNYSYAQYDFQEVLKIDRHNLKALKGMGKKQNKLAYALKMQCNFEEALKYSLKYLKQDPNASKANFHIADCLKFLGLYNQNSLNFIDLAIDLEKKKYEKSLQIRLRNKSEILFGLNRWKEAFEQIEKVIEINQNYEKAIQTKKRFEEKILNQVLQLNN